MQSRHDVYSQVTSELVTAIEAGAGEWRMPWHHDGAAVTRPENVASNRRYRGINVLVLWAAAQNRGYASGLWGTYRQWHALGAQVRKGERGIAVVLWKPWSGKEDGLPAEGRGAERPGRMFARAFIVFNLAQVDGYQPHAPPVLPESERIVHAEAFAAALGVPIREGAYNAHYRIDLDAIFMPPFSAFRSAVDHVGTLLHECGHATGARHRLDRRFQDRFRDDWLPIEEACAEFTASFVLADLGLAHHPRRDHAAYIASWLSLLKNDPRAIFTAAGKAQQAADWMWAQQPSADVLAA
ncbi:N-terminus replication primase [Novosphingobium nitrogenifigens DSM 19370]|uniref:N-terminus replication primase n=1 Tax=Novosphingobium nitrogenifigens DSM 19370 TaxID=983920 RepID=F1ZAJ9_9SPHN|nr:zincin-like metallopeptidase domain-containing protein [Novosphingobium nitrogenifigens]EGD58364.1 N-terminus replication primase [Novosphingobium nitrogenifigens DSM 19370]